MPRQTLAMDFGTSNSAAAILVGDTPMRIAVDDGYDTLPTAVFFPSDGTEMQIGRAATKALIDGHEGRYMRALKNVLGTSLFNESKLVGGKRQTLSDIVTAFIAMVKHRAEATTGERFTHVLSGRPVHFHTSDPTRDARAQSDLRACYLAAGFEQVTFMFEPEAAALASYQHGQIGKIGLIVDIGGGTSDFSLFQRQDQGFEILASHGIRLGGTDFDHAISMKHVMPLLGHGGNLRREFGDGLLPVPKAIYNDLATWAKIPFLYSRKTQLAAAQMAQLAVDPKAFARLQTLLDFELGHELAFAVERGKIAANSENNTTPMQPATIPMGFIEPGLTPVLTKKSLDLALQGFRHHLGAAAKETLRLAGVPENAVSNVILVGGSSLMQMVAAEMRLICPAANQSYNDAFTAVIDGLARATSALPAKP